jgi:predicted Zn-dependent protease with MMP-like domain
LIKFCVNLFTVLFILSFSFKATANDCRLFKPYINLNYPALLKINSIELKNSKEEIIEKISSLPSHEYFKTLYYTSKMNQWSEKRQIQYLNCIHHYINIDIDNDGIKDWKIIADNLLQNQLIENDIDWDNDGIINLFDLDPTKVNFLPAFKVEEIPQHLKLENNLISSKNNLQNEIFKNCGILPLNDTDQHLEAVLESILSLCSDLLKDKQYYTIKPFLIYAFASHAINSGIVASFYPELNQMSVGGELSKKYFKSKNKINLIIAHEIGHYFTFNYLTPRGLINFYNKFNPSDIRQVEIHSFYSDSLIKSIELENPQPLKSEYAKANIHEWFSEFFAHYRVSQIGLNISEKTEELIFEKMTHWLVLNEHIENQDIH